MITSLQNDRIKQVRALQEKRRARRKSGLFVLEGANLAAEVVQAQAPVSEVFYTEDFASSDDGPALLDELSSLGAVLIAVDDAVMGAISDTVAPQGIVVVAPIPAEAGPDVVSFALIIDAISDPGNMGTIMRTAAAAGVPQMIITAGTVDLTNPKVVRSAMGAHFRLPVRQLSWEGIASRYHEHVIFMAETGTGGAYHDVNWQQPCALIVSDEAHGPGEEARRTASAYVSIPMPGGGDSLNVSIATGILLFEMARQRGGVIEDAAEAE